MILILSDYIYKHSHITHILEKSCFNMPVSLLSRIFLSFQLHIVVTCLLAVLPFMSFQIHVIATCSPPVLSVDIKVLLFSSAFYRGKVLPCFHWVIFVSFFFSSKLKSSIWVCYCCLILLVFLKSQFSIWVWWLCFRCSNLECHEIAFGFFLCFFTCSN